MPLNINHLQAIRVGIKALGLDDTQGLSERCLEDDLERSYKGLKNWLKTQQPNEALLPLRRVVAYQIASADLENNSSASEADVVKLAFPHLYPRALPKLHITYFKKEAFLKGEYICLMDGTSPTIMDCPHTPVFQTCLKPNDIPRAIRALKQHVANFNVASDDLKHLDEYAQAKATQAVLDAFEQKLEPHLEDEDIAPAIREFLASLPHRFTKTGFTGTPSSPDNVFCAQLAWMVADKHNVDALKHFWQMLYPELDPAQSRDNLPRYGEALLDAKLAQGQKGQLINYRRCYAERDLKRFDENAQLRIQRFHSPHADYWGNTLKPQQALHYSNYLEFFEGVHEFLHEHSSSRNAANEEGIPESAQAIFLPMQQQMLAFKHLVSVNKVLKAQFELLEMAFVLLRVINDITTPALKTLQSCFDSNHEHSKPVFRDDDMRAFLQSIPCNPATLKISQTQSESMQGRDALMHHADYCPPLSNYSDENMADLINHSDNSISMDAIAGALNLTQDKRKSAKRLYNITACIYDLGKKRAFVKACLGDDLDVTEILSVDVNAYLMILQLFRQLGFDEHIQSILDHLKAQEVLMTMLRTQSEIDLSVLFTDKPLKEAEPYITALAVNLQTISDTIAKLQHFKTDFPEHANFFDGLPGLTTLHSFSSPSYVRSFFSIFAKQGSFEYFIEFFDPQALRKIYKSIQILKHLITQAGTKITDTPSLLVLKKLGAEHVKKHLPAKDAADEFVLHHPDISADHPLTVWLRETYFPVPETLEKLNLTLRHAPPPILNNVLTQIKPEWFIDNIQTVDDLLIVFKDVPQQRQYLLINPAGQTWVHAFFKRNHLRLNLLSDLDGVFAANLIWSLDRGALQKEFTSFESFMQIARALPENFRKPFINRLQNTGWFLELIKTPEHVIELYQIQPDMVLNVPAIYADKVCTRADDFLTLNARLPVTVIHPLIERLGDDWFKKHFNTFKKFSALVQSRSDLGDLVKTLAPHVITRDTVQRLGVKAVIEGIPKEYHLKTVFSTDDDVFTHAVQSAEDLQVVANAERIPTVKKAMMTRHLTLDQFSAFTQHDRLSSHETVQRYEFYFTDDRVEKTKHIFRLLAKEQFFGWFRHRRALRAINNPYLSEPVPRASVMNTQLQRDSLLREAWHLAGIEEEKEQIKKTYVKVFEQKFYSVSKATGSTVFFSSTLKRAKITVDTPDPGRRLHAVHQALGLNLKP